MNNSSTWSWMRMSKDWGKFQFVVVEYPNNGDDRGVMRAQFERVMDAVKFCAMMNASIIGEGNNNAK